MLTPAVAQIGGLQQRREGEAHQAVLGGVASQRQQDPQVRALRQRHRAGGRVGKRDSAEDDVHGPDGGGAGAGRADQGEEEARQHEINLHTGNLGTGGLGHFFWKVLCVLSRKSTKETNKSGARRRNKVVLDGIGSPQFPHPRRVGPHPARGSSLSRDGVALNGQWERWLPPQRRRRRRKGRNGVLEQLDAE